MRKIERLTRTLNSLVSWRFSVHWLPTKHHYGFGFGIWKNDMMQNGNEIIWTLALGWITVYWRAS